MSAINAVLEGFVEGLFSILVICILVAFTLGVIYWVYGTIKELLQ